MLKDSGEYYSMVSDSFARPANVTAYAALDVVGDGAVLTFPDAVLGTGDHGMIKTAKIATDQVTNTAVFRLHLYRSAPTVIADNAPMVLRYTERASYLGYIDFPAMATEGVTALGAYAMNQGVDLPFVGGSGESSIYGLLETIGIFTPASAQNFHIELCIRQM